MEESTASILVIFWLAFCGFMAMRKSDKSEGLGVRTKDYRHYLTDAERDEERKIDIDNAHYDFLHEGDEYNPDDDDLDENYKENDLPF